MVLAGVLLLHRARSNRIDPLPGHSMINPLVLAVTGKLMVLTGMLEGGILIHKATQILSPELAVRDN